jgi:hypothetical protein
MESEQKRGRNSWMVAAKAAAWLLLLLVLYVSAYYALIVPAKAKPRSGIVVVIAIYPTEWMEALFEPIHRIDRMIRWRTWKP